MNGKSAASRRRLLASGGAVAGALALRWPAATLVAGGAPVVAAAATVNHALSRLPPLVLAQSGELRRLGAGTMRWFGLHVYDAALWVREGAWDAADLFALDILYARDISGKALAESSITEMKRVGFTDEAQHARWLPAMARIFPDVGRGDRLVGLNIKGGATFFNQDRLLGSIDDPVFARAFFAIWLDPRTREPQLRNRLFGKG